MQANKQPGHVTLTKRVSDELIELMLIYSLTKKNAFFNPLQYRRSLGKINLHAPVQP